VIRLVEAKALMVMEIRTETMMEVKAEKVMAVVGVEVRMKMTQMVVETEHSYSCV
jgi:hypothetical protein